MKIADAEWRARTMAARRVAQSKGLDFLLLTSPENIYYYSGFRTTLYTRFCCVAIPAGDEEPTLIIPSVDAQLALRDWWSPTWYPESWVRVYGPSRPVTDYMVFIRELVRPKSRIGVDSLSYAAYSDMERRIPGLQAVPVNDELNALKQVKSETEIAALRRANEIAVDAHENLREYLNKRAREGQETTELDIALEMDRFAKSQGADGFGYPTLVSFGDKMLAPHSPPLRRVIPRDTVVRVAFGCTYEGYTADVIRTYVIGNPPVSIMKLADAFLSAQQACLELIRPGVTIEDLVDVCKRVYTAKGVLDAWDGPIGHGVGLTITSPPGCSWGHQAS